MNIIYKYRSFSNKYNKKSLFDFELFFASTNKFNDPFEGNIPIEYDLKNIKPEDFFLKSYSLAKQNNPEWDDNKIHQEAYDAQYKKLHLYDSEHKKKNREILKNSIIKKFGILSLATDPKNYLMWSHYANGHNGFCLGFDKNDLMNVCSGIIRKVNYVTEIPKMDLFESMEGFSEKLLFTKSKVWDYENEYRIVKIDFANQIIKYPESILKEIYLGCNLNQKFKFEIIDFVKERKINCKIFDITINVDRFKLDVNLIY